MAPKQVPPLQVRVDIEAMAMNGYSTLPKYPQLKSHKQMIFTYTQDIIYW